MFWSGESHGLYSLVTKSQTRLSDFHSRVHLVCLLSTDRHTERRTREGLTQRRGVQGRQPGGPRPADDRQGLGGARREAGCQRRVQTARLQPWERGYLCCLSLPVVGLHSRGAGTSLHCIRRPGCPPSLEDRLLENGHGSTDVLYFLCLG